MKRASRSMRSLVVGLGYPDLCSKCGSVLIYFWYLDKHVDYYCSACDPHPVELDDFFYLDNEENEL
ncbi:MAG: hypothetical protein ACXACY_25270 [Candidatus Hodarchaeales archaeon]|jgi:hypothetical protein